MQDRKDAGSRADRTAQLLLLVILAVAAALRIHDLDRTSLWYDEAVSWSQSTGSFGQLLSSVAADNYPPLHNIILWSTMPLIGDSEFALRLPSALLGVMAVGLIYLGGKMMQGRAAALTAAALLALSPFHVWYSTEARMYALLAACGLAFLVSTLKVLRSPRPAWVIALSLSGALFLYSHVYALLAFASVGCVCAGLVLSGFLRSGSMAWKKPLIACCAMAVSALLFLPWLLILMNRARSVADAGFWIAYPDLAFLKGMAFSMAGSMVLFWLLSGLALFSLALSLMRSLGSGSRHKDRTYALPVIVGYTIGPLLLAYLYSVLVQPILFDRYLIAAWPGLLIMASDGASRLNQRLAPVALVLIAMTLTYPELRFTLLEKIRPEWRDVVHDYKSLRSPDDHLILFKGFSAPALAYYLRDEDGFEPAETTEDLMSLSRSSASDWLLIVHSGPEETERAADLFRADVSRPAAQYFGWGASGLKLLKIER
ncbi:hypothetical protein FMN50_20945 [Rhodobacterales bacterium]|nr:hypothetical protein FMN50_20945 [Rhodobacterales bacterium]